MTKGEPRLVPANLIWDRRGAAFGLLLAVPGTVVIALGHVKPGVELLVGMLVAALVGSVGHFFSERTLETLTGVGIAYLFGLAVPKVIARRSHALAH